MVSALVVLLACFLIGHSAFSLVRLIVQEGIGRRRRHEVNLVELPHTQVIYLSAGDFAQLKDAIENPKAPSPRLWRAARRLDVEVRSE